MFLLIESIYHYHFFIVKIILVDHQESVVLYSLYVIYVHNKKYR